MFFFFISISNLRMYPLFDMIYGMGDSVWSHSEWETLSGGEFYLVGIERAWEGRGHGERGGEEEEGKREAGAISSEEWTEK